MQTAFVRLLHVDPAERPADRGQREPGAREILAQARCRVETFGLDAEPTGGRSTSQTGPGRHALPADARTGRDLGEFALPLAGRAQRPERAGGARGRGRERRRAGRRRARRSRRSGASSGGWSGAARRAASPSTTTSRTIRPRCARRCRRCARSARQRAAGGGLRAALVHVAHTRLPGRLRARVRRAPTASIVAAAHLPGKVPEAAAALGGGAGRRDPRGGRPRPSSFPSVDAIVAALSAELRDGRPRRDPLERRLRRHPREAAARRSAP